MSRGISSVHTGPDEQVKAMGSLGFGISAGGGSAYKFTPTRVDWSEPVTMHRVSERSVKVVRKLTLGNVLSSLTMEC